MKTQPTSASLPFQLLTLCTQAGADPTDPRILQLSIACRACLEVEALGTRNGRPVKQLEGRTEASILFASLLLQHTSPASTCSRDTALSPV